MFSGMVKLCRRDCDCDFMGNWGPWPSILFNWPEMNLKLATQFRRKLWNNNLISSPSVESLMVILERVQTRFQINSQKDFLDPIKMRAIRPPHTHISHTFAADWITSTVHNSRIMTKWDPHNSHASANPPLWKYPHVLPLFTGSSNSGCVLATRWAHIRNYPNCVVLLLAFDTSFYEL